MHSSHSAAGIRPLELLAPAGGLDAAYAAIHYGADAIYLGLPRFSARAAAVNFSLDDLAAIIGYAHSREVRRRVYVTINTLVQERELNSLVEDLVAVDALGVDAVIVQDLGVYRILRRYFPDRRLHASTQMAIHNRLGAEQARALGFARVTLARELTFEEVADLSGLSGIETEVFIHGALCYSYSGLCLYSSHMLGRSGNRGRCAYLCRDQYRQGGRRSFIFSMKDLALSEFVPKLRQAGVTALKIEGRMKSPLYVAAVVNYYRRLIDNALTAEQARTLAADIQTIFSRPWTSLFLPDRRNRAVIEPDYVGHRGHAIGRVEEIVRSRSGGMRLRFHSSQPLEVHDGLQLEIKGLPRPYGFAVERLRILDNAAGAKAGLVFEAPSGVRVEVDVPADHPEIPKGAVIYCASSQEIKRRYRYEKPKPGLFRTRCPVAFEISIRPEGVQATARLTGEGAAESIAVAVNSPGEFHVAGDADQMRRTVEQAFGKLGATRFAKSRLTVHNPSSCFIPVSQLNQVRREVADQLETRYQKALSDRVARLATAVAGGTGSLPSPAVPLAAVRWCLKTDQPAGLNGFEDADWQNVEEIVLEVPPDATASFDATVRQVAERIDAARLRLALPVIMRPWEQPALQQTVRRLVDGGWRRWQAANLGSWGLLQAVKESVEEKGAVLDISADWPMYVLNHVAAEQLLSMGATRLTLSPEDEGENMRRLLAVLGGKAEVVVYQDTPLMISEVGVVPIAAETSSDEPAIGTDGRGTCRSGEWALTSSFREHIRVVSRHGRLIVIHNKPFCLAPHLPALVSAGAQILRVDFIYRDYTADQMRSMWRRLRARPVHPAWGGTHAGNFVRGLI